MNASELNNLIRSQQDGHLAIGKEENGSGSFHVNFLLGSEAVTIDNTFAFLAFVFILNILATVFGFCFVSRKETGDLLDTRIPWELSQSSMHY